MTEDNTDEDTEETDTPDENEGEEADGEEENKEDETEEETEEEAEEAEPLTDDQLIELGYRKVQILNANGADIYAGIEAEVIGHADFESELWIKDAETEGWAEIYTEEETKTYVKLAELDKQPLTEEEIEALGYRKVQILNENGADIYDSTEEEAAVIGHADFESELWIKDTEAEGWAEIFSEEETKQFVKLAEIEKQLTFEEQMLADGYIKVFVALDIGANIYADSAEYEGEEAIDHLETGTELWVKLIEGANRAEIYNEDAEAAARYINLVDIIATLKPEDMEELPTRSISIDATIAQETFVYYGSWEEMTANLEGFMEDDVYTVQWQYSEDQGENFVDIEEANELLYGYYVNETNIHYIWRILITLQTKIEE